MHRILVRHELNRLVFLDWPTGQVIRRYERDRPGELIHVDVKKLGRTPTVVATRPWAVRLAAPSNCQFLWISAESLKWPAAIDRGLRSLCG